ALLTWSTSLANAGATFTQNDALTIHAFGSAPPYPYGGYTTRNPLVPVGGSVFAQVTVNNAFTHSSPTLTRFHLTTDPSGAARTASTSSNVEIYASFEANGPFIGVYGGEQSIVNGFETAYGASPLSPISPSFSTPFVWQIERLTSSNIRISLFSEGPFNPNGTRQISLVGSGIQSNFTTSDPMYIFLESIGTDTTFDDVTINSPIPLNATSVFVPEPMLSVFLLIAFATLPTLSRRRSQSMKSPVL
ncbi:MAG TPA: hypothetical protein VFE58_18635, partial [Tepidisphaeraceae bacterium]|nr:hypothetical protein [Tepidisphaeraceae bacterium]